MSGGSAAGRILETGAILGALTLILAGTGLFLSPTMADALGADPPPGDVRNVLYVTHMAAAVLLVAFVAWHLWPLARSFARKAGAWPWRQLLSYLLLALLVVEIVTGYVLWAHDYRLLGKALSVHVHLAVTFLIVAPLAGHAARGVAVWRTRRAARTQAFSVATEKGRGSQAVAARQTYTRRAFLRLSAYTAAGIALALAFGRAVSDRVSAWRLNSIGRIPELDKDTWRLKVRGLVRHPVEIGFDDLLRMAPVTRRFTHHCVEGWSYTDDWTGVPLRKVIERAGGVRPEARMLIMRSPEVSTRRLTRGQAYTTNFPHRDDLLDDVWLVFEVAGRDMPPEHGGPVRVLSPVKWGYKACKWVTEIELSDDASYRGYWERLGYHNVGDYPGPIFD